MLLWDNDSQFPENYSSNWKISDLMSFQISQIYSKTKVFWKQVTLFHHLVPGVIRCVFEPNASLIFPKCLGWWQRFHSIIWISINSWTCSLLPSILIYIHIYANVIYAVLGLHMFVFHWFFSFPLFLRKTASVYTLFWIVCAPECLSARGNKIKKPEFIFIAKLCWTFTVDQVNKKNLGYRNELSQPAPKLRRKKQTSVKSTGMQGTGDPSNSGDKMFLQDS